MSGPRLVCARNPEVACSPSPAIARLDALLRNSRRANLAGAGVSAGSIVLLFYHKAAMRSPRCFETNAARPPRLHELTPLLRLLLFLLRRLRRCGWRIVLRGRAQSLCFGGFLCSGLRAPVP